MRTYFFIVGALILGLFVVSFTGYIWGTRWITTSTTTSTNSNPQIAALIAFRNSSDPTVRTQSVQSLKKQYLLSTSTKDRALIINALIGMAHAAHESYIFDAIFDGQPFHSMLADDPMESLDNLANYSLTLHPTAYAEQISAFKAGEDLADLASAQQTADADPRIKENADLVLAHVELAKKYIGSDLLDASSPEDSTQILTSFMQWEGHLLGDVSMAYPQYLPTSLDYISKAIAVAESSRNERGNSLPQLRDRITTLHFGYTRYALSDKDPKTRPADIAEHVHALIQLLREYPQDNTNFYIAMRQAREMQAQNFSGMNMQNASSSTVMSQGFHEHLIKEFLGNLKKVSDFSPEAKQFFAEQGFHFN